MEIAYMLAGALCAMGGMIVARLIDSDARVHEDISVTAEPDRATIEPLAPSEEELKIQKQWDEMMDFDPLAKKEAAELEED